MDLEDNFHRANDYLGLFAAVHGDVLTARNDARIAPTHYTDWLS
jgi:hypothetical protein